MGLDMYLYRAKRVPDLKPEDYIKINSYLEDLETTDVKSLGDDFSLEKATGIKGSDALKEEVHTVGEYLHWLSIFHRAGYWRKANAIHGWIVKNVQGGIDECEYSEFPLEKIRELFWLCVEVARDPKKGPELLPTTQGFFFGSYGYDEWYLSDIYETIEILAGILKDPDLGGSIFFYRSSW